MRRLCALCALASLAAPGPVVAGSSFSGAGGQAAGSARLMFKIVIPSILVLDTRSGTIYSNDSKTRMVVGTVVVPREGGEAVTGVPLVRSARIDAGGATVHPVGTARSTGAFGYPSGRVVTRGLAGGDVLCVP